MKDDENRILFIKDVEITDGNADTKHLVLSTAIEKCGGIECLTWFGSDGASVIIEHKKVASKLKKGLIPK